MQRGSRHSGVRREKALSDPPIFAEPIPNVTVALGRDVSLPCVIENLGSYKSLYLKYYASTNRAKKNRFPCEKKRQTRNRYLVYFVICGLVPLALKTTVRQPYWKRISCPVRELDARRHYTAACRRSTLHTNKHIGRRNERCSFPK
ncbi:hypothetical protein ALC60_00130 [Trachymyrmex zeteki]|uniref:Ig-like domain-containing protein n=1 Tax=Mycetomoellerius zeteki TaxID=64791 RepID=A0A151XK49_9HYME|nr:hypothetical protein ALC60_00130 [Trachymyrmex zeteki]